MQSRISAILDTLLLLATGLSDHDLLYTIKADDSDTLQFPQSQAVRPPHKVSKAGRSAHIMTTAPVIDSHHCARASGESQQWACLYAGWSGENDISTMFAKALTLGPDTSHSKQPVASSRAGAAAVEARGAAPAMFRPGQQQLLATVRTDNSVQG